MDGGRGGEESMLEGRVKGNINKRESNINIGVLVLFSSFVFGLDRLVQDPGFR